KTSARLQIYTQEMIGYHLYGSSHRFFIVRRGSVRMCKKVPELSESKEKAAEAAFLSFCT
ncbi:hypothetical protein, partial [Cronobacter sakazakii]|uniref:hypothetical protein n=1 Tax=Cronobacter sakazakii TaxID=28141 RepID=UPI001F291EEE